MIEMFYFCITFFPFFSQFGCQLYPINSNQSFIIRIPRIRPPSPAVWADLMIRRATHLLQAAKTPIVLVTPRQPGALLHAGILPAEYLTPPSERRANHFFSRESRPNSNGNWTPILGVQLQRTGPAPKSVALAVTTPRLLSYNFFQCRYPCQGRLPSTKNRGANNCKTLFFI